MASEPAGVAAKENVRRFNAFRWETGCSASALIQIGFEHVVETVKSEAGIKQSEH